MKKYTVARARQRFAQALDEAERGEPVFIERKGVVYRLSLDRPKKTTSPRKTHFEIVDAAVEAGQWTWDWSPGTLAFRSKPRASPGSKR